MRRWLIVGTVLVAVGAGCGYALLRAFDAPGPLGQAADLVVPRGGLGRVTDALQHAGVIGRPLLFRGFAAVTAWQGPLHAAELAFPAQASIAQVLMVLRSGVALQHRLTIPEGLTSARVAGVLVGAGALDGEIELPAEGSVLPQTYAFERGAGVRSVLARARRAMDHAMEQAWATRAPDLRLASPRELGIVASLVERETHLAAERGVVARVFYNRLAHHMRLQSDPTVVYGASGGEGELERGLSRADLEGDTPYNTYVVAGLPAGPICNPGVLSIEAAAHPARTDALYFVADGSGGHVFSDTLDEHLKNVRRARHLKGQ